MPRVRGFSNIILVKLENPNDIIIYAKTIKKIFQLRQSIPPEWIRRFSNVYSSYRYPIHKRLLVPLEQEDFIYGSTWPRGCLKQSIFYNSNNYMELTVSELIERHKKGLI